MIDPARLPDDPRDGYADLRATAARVAGAPGDIARRVVVHHAIYRDSRGNHAFPLVALHGALWAAGFFESTGRLGELLRARYFYSGRERDSRMAMLSGFAIGFKAVNRQVFIDTFTNYFYTKHYGARPEAAAALHPDLFGALTAMHRAVASGTALTGEQKLHLFLQALRYEQEITVAPGVRAEIARFDCAVLRFLCLRPLVRFAYFPRGTFFFFRNFADTDERIAKAVRSFALAERAGWPAVESAMRAYGTLPPTYWSAPAQHLEQALR